MPAEKADAIVLRTAEFSETSLVVTLFSREFGKLRGLAKGGRRLKGPFESALDLLAHVRVVFLRKSPDTLNLLTEAKLVRRFRIPGRDLSALYAAYYVAELLGALTDDFDPHPELFDLAEETLVALSAGEPVLRHLLRFELGALRILGHLPSLDRCAECGAGVPATGQVPFALLDGGVVCAECRTGKRQVVALSAGSVRLMAAMAEPAERLWQRVAIDPSRRGELRRLLNQYVTHLLGHRPRMQAYLKYMTG